MKPTLPPSRRDESRHYTVPGYGHVYWHLDLKDPDESIADLVKEGDKAKVEFKPLAAQQVPIDIDFERLINWVASLDESDPVIAQLYELLSQIIPDTEDEAKSGAGDSPSLGNGGFDEIRTFGPSGGGLSSFMPGMGDIMGPATM